MKHLMKLLAVVGAFAMVSCEMPSAPSMERVLNYQSGDTIPAFVGDTFDLDVVTGRSYGFNFWNTQNVSNVVWHEARFMITCITEGFDEIEATPPETVVPDFYTLHCKLPPPPSFPIPTPVGVPVNVGAHFREVDGWEAQALEIQPPELAEQVAIIPAARASRNSPVSIVAATGTDVGLLCKASGRGVVRVLFEPGDAPDHVDFSLTCRAPHNQGGGG